MELQQTFGWRRREGLRTDYTPLRYAGLFGFIWFARLFAAAWLLLFDMGRTPFGWHREWCPPNVCPPPPAPTQVLRSQIDPGPNRCPPEADARAGVVIHILAHQARELRQDVDRSGRRAAAPRRTLREGAQRLFGLLARRGPRSASRGRSVPRRLSRGSCTANEASERGQDRAVRQLRQAKRPLLAQRSRETTGSAITMGDMSSQLFA